MSALNFIGAHCNGTVVYVGVADHGTFDSIARPQMDHRPATSLLTKSIEQDGCTVIFQHWLELPELPA